MRARGARHRLLSPNDTPEVTNGTETTQEDSRRHGEERRLPVPPGRKTLLWITTLIAVGLMIALRLVALDSDAYARLSWSAALLTDEGFYIHNARNVVLFGHARMDGFNNDLIMPTLHYVQVAVFSLFGVGAIQARLISVALSLLMLPVFFAALRRVFGLQVATVGTLFLGLDHVNLLYNRMALMDTPAALLMVCAFYTFLRAIQSPPGSSRLWFMVCGLLLGLTFATRSLAAFLLPIPFLVYTGLKPRAETQRPLKRAKIPPLSLGARGRALDRISPPLNLGEGKGVGARGRGEVGSLAIGLAVALIAYALLWYLPHRAEMAPASRYYLQHQLNPHSFLQAGRNLMHALFGDERGMSPYLFRHTPVQFLLALAGLLAWTWEGRKRKIEPERRAAMKFLGLWLLAAWAVLAVVSYAPSRYYVLFYPALAGVAALALVSLPDVAGTIASSRWARTLLGGFAAFHLTEGFLHRQIATHEVAVYMLTAAVMIALWIWPQRRQESHLPRCLAVGVVLLLWAAVNLYWTGDWLAHLSYAQRDADRWLAANLPPNSILIGDLAPGLCLDNRFQTINVIPGLCNDRSPVERFAPEPRYIIILDGKWKERWWLQHYPQYVAQTHRIHLFPRLLHWPVGVYALEPPHIARISIRSKGGV